jgi:SAM-dependent methyltransferase
LERAFRFDPYSGYGELAERIKYKTEIERGRCLEIHAGNGLIGLALARVTALHLDMLVDSAEMTRIASRNIRTWGMESRITISKWDGRVIPFEEGSFDLVICGRSIFTKPSQAKLVSAIYRMLAPGGIAWIGCGLEAEQLRCQLKQRLEPFGAELAERLNRQSWNREIHQIQSLLVREGIRSFEINGDFNGLWTFFWKAGCAKPGPERIEGAYPLVAG